MIQNRATWGKQDTFWDKTKLRIGKSMTLLLKLQSFQEHSHAFFRKKTIMPFPVTLSSLIRVMGDR